MNENTLWEAITGPWPWYVAGPLIGLMVPALLLIGNKALGISSSLRHVCAACVPAGIPFFKYDWRAHRWNLLFVAGVFVGGFVAGNLLADPAPFELSAATEADLRALGVRDFSALLPADVFGWEGLFSARGLVLYVLGGFLVGFGTRWAGGCTSGHAIMGLSNLQWPSLVATVAFFAGGLLMTHAVFPYLLPWLLR
ncbi:MAG: YeeE/YedE thiosulfate transporter family protein [Catalinimonas sp.]